MFRPVSRREFLAASAAAGAAVTLGGLGRVARAADRFGGLPIGIQSYSLRKFPLPQVIRHTRGLGLHFIEFSRVHLKPEQTREVDSLLSKLRAADITMNAFGVSGFTKDHEANRKLFEFAKRAGVRNLTANPQPDSFDSLEKLVDEYDVRIAIHNHGPGALYDKLDSVAKAIEGRDKRIGVCIDTGHVLRSGENPVEWAKALGPRVFAVHLKDVAEMQKRTHDVVIGTAHLDVEGLFQTLRAIQFPADGSISVEYESSPDNPIDDIKQCLVVAERAIAKTAG